MFDEFYFKVANGLHFLGNIAMGITFIIFLLTVLYIVVYTYADVFSHNNYRYKQNIKKWLGVIIVGVIITIILHVLGVAITPEVYK